MDWVLTFGWKDGQRTCRWWFSFSAVMTMADRIQGCTDWSFITVELERRIGSLAFYGRKKSSCIQLLVTLLTHRVRRASLQKMMRLPI